MSANNAVLSKITRYSPPQLTLHVLFMIRMLPVRLLQRIGATLLLCVGMIIATAATNAFAQNNRPEETISFDIPEQPLQSALAQYFSATGVQLLYDNALAAGHRSSPVKGRYTPREALRILLARTGLIVRYSRSDAAIITTPAGSDQPDLVPLGRVVVREQVQAVRIPSIDRLTYYDQLESELHDYLETNERTARLSFSLVVHLRIADDGAVQDVGISRGSGNRKTDTLITEALTQAVVSPPPEGLQQPLAISLRGTRNAHRR